MKHTFLPVILILTCSLARADLTIVSEVESEGQRQEMTMKISGEKARVDINEQMTSLLDGKSGDSVMLMHGQRKAMKITGDGVQGMMEQLQAQQKTDPARVDLKATGEKETINEFETERYTYTAGNVTTDMWLAKDFPDAKEALAQLQIFQKSGLNRLAQSAGTPDMEKLPGFPVRTTTTTGGKTVVSTVKSVNQDKVPASEFEIPDGYETMKLPMMPGAPGAGQ